MAKKETNKLLIGSALAGIALTAATAYAAKKIKDKKKEEEINKVFIDENSIPPENRHAYFIGGGLASLAGAAYLLRDCGFKGENIHIIEGSEVLGGSNTDTFDSEKGFVCPNERMLNEETYENFWELFKTIPSVEDVTISVTDEILNFNAQHPTSAKARLINKDGEILDLTSMGFDKKDRLLLSKLMATPEKRLYNRSIEEWFQSSPNFFTTNFWYMWQTTFAFQKWSSILEFKRYMERMINSYPKIATLEGVTSTPYNQYESVILPLKAHLENQNVNFILNTVVTDMIFKPGDEITVENLILNNNGEERVVTLNPYDICLMTNGSMTDNSTLGSYNTPAEYKPENPISANLWRKISAKKPALGNPDAFFNNPDETNWQSFTITCKGNKLLKMIEKLSGNIPGSGALMTFKDSSWLMSIVVPAQPYFKNQPLDTTVLWGYGLYTSAEGDYINKPMKDCTGEEILTELLYNLHFDNEIDEIKETIINVIPCMMPYINSQFQVREKGDRPSIVPNGSTNFAMISQYVEIPEDIVFTEEYSVRAARIAVYKLLGINAEICPVTKYKKNYKIVKDAIKTTYK